MNPATRARLRRTVSAIGATAVCMAVGVGLLPTATATANTQINAFTPIPSTTQAGGHPDLTTVLDYGVPAQGYEYCSRSYIILGCVHNAKDLDVKLPAGVIGDPHSTPQCTAAEFALDHCPSDSQIGIALFGLGSFVNLHQPVTHAMEQSRDCHAEWNCYATVPMYNMVPVAGQPALISFTFPIANVPLFLVLHPRTESDYGLTASIANASHTITVGAVATTIWGVPADPIHDPDRFPQGYEPSIFGGGTPYAPTPSNSPLQPFTENPTSCVGPLSASFHILSYDHGTSEAESPWPETTGCDQLSFEPSLTAQPTTNDADSPSGLDVDLTVPQLESPTVPSPSEIKGTTVTLPPGFTINPSAADGKTSCSDAQAEIGTEGEAHCPEFAKIGTVAIQSAALPGTLPGAVYIGEPRSGDRYRLIIVADGFGVHVKIPGSVYPDPQTGQLIASFQNLPQAPFQDFALHFFGSERGVLATPTHCGTYPIKAGFLPYDEALPERHTTQFFTIDSGPNGSACPPASRPFAPSLSAGSADATAGAHSPFSLSVNRPDGDQSLTGLTVSTPPGLAATLKGIPYCPEAAIVAAAAPGYSGASEAAHPSCPAASQVGTATAGAGAGTHPFYAPGKVYLAGPYKGAPLSLAVITPAVSGPYDLGSVVVRAALHIDPTTARVTTVSDPLPQILGGVPLRLRSVRIDLNRPGFTLNPTNCDPFSVGASLSGDQGAKASPSAPFQAANCAVLPFAPKLSIDLEGGTKRSQDPALTAILTAPAGQANIKRASVALPHAEFLDNEHIKTVCTKVQLAAHKCPPAAVYGFARAFTPLLDNALEGPVYLGTGYGHKLPDLIADLKGPAGQPIEVILDGRIDTDKSGGIRTSFEAAPDAPVSKFVLEMQGGNKGLLENSEPLCKGIRRAIAKLEGQNGKAANQRPVVTNSCGHKAKKDEKKRQAGKSGRAGR